MLTFSLNTGDAFLHKSRINKEKSKKSMFIFLLGSLVKNKLRGWHLRTE